MNISKGFTLSEVLITLGIIGVVAAITIPGLITKYKKANIETKLRTFNATMSQAIKLAENDYGEASGWIFDSEVFGETYKNKTMASYEQNKKFVEKYLIPYIKLAKLKKDSNLDKKVYVQMLNGTVFTFSYQADVVGGTHLALITLYIDGNTANRSTQNHFGFMLDETNFIKPFDINWNNSRSKLLNDATWGCKNGEYSGRKNGLYCTKLIQLNNWKIPSDYPW